MSTLFTGATGFLGAASIERSLEHGVRGIRCLVRPGAARHQLQALQARHGRDALELVEGTLTRRRDVERALLGVERVVHLAASLTGAAADMFLNTVVGTRNLYDAVLRSTVHRLVAISTIATYDLHDLPTATAVTESTRLDPHPERRDVYSHSKIEQERLASALRMRSTLECIILRPGPLYGRGRGALPSRVGLKLPGLLLQLGTDAPLPLCYIENCAEAVRLAAFSPSVRAGAYNVVDFDTPSADEYIAQFRREVHALRVVRLPYFATELLAQLNESSHRASNGHVPLILTPYRVRNMWRGHRYDTTRLTMAGWIPPVPTRRALATAFAGWRTDHVVTSSGPRLVPR